MEVHDARLDDRPFRSVCARIADQAGATRWVLLWPDGDGWARLGEPDPRDAWLASIASRRPTTLDRVDPRTLGDAGVRLHAAGVVALSAVRLDHRSPAILYLEDPIGAVDGAVTDGAGWLGVALDGAVRAGPSGALARWVGLLPAIADGRSSIDDALAGLAGVFDLRAVVVACPTRRGVRVLSWFDHELGAVPMVEDVDFDAEWADVVAAPEQLLDQLPADRPSARVRSLAVASDHRLALAAEGPHGLDDVAPVLVADLLAQALGNHSVGASAHDRVRQAERTRLATALHEELSQRLAALTVQIDLLRARAGGDDRRDELAGLRSGVVDALESLRSAIYELTPPEPDWAHLHTGLARFVEDHAASRGLDVSFVVHGEPRPIEPDLVSMVFATVQEGLTNVAKHAGVQEAAVEVTFEPSMVTIEIRDEGVGAIAGPSDGVDRGHQGLGVLRTRARLVGASLAIDSVSGSGTTVRLRVPTSEPDDR